MRYRLSSFLMVPLLLFVVAAQGAAAGFGGAQDPAPQDPGQYQDPNQAQYPDQSPDQGVYQNFSPDQLDNLLSPIALYPDPLLAQVLLAATFPDQVDEAARFLRGGAPPEDIDAQPWDVSVKAVAHYPTVLYMMDNRLDWTTSVGQAYANQSSDVQESIQRLRQMAHDNGALATTPQMEVEQQGPYWAIWPANPQFIYVPVYDPAVVFVHRGFGVWVGGPFVTFTVGYPIGVWCIWDFDWGHRGIFYTGWGGPLAPWAVRARPFIHVNNVYLNDRFRTVVVNREVTNRRVNVDNLRSYNAVHQNVRYNNVAVTNIQRRAESNNRPVSNQVMQRNINSNNPQLDNFRGREAAPAPQARPEAQRAPQAAPPRSAFNVEQRQFNPQQSSARGQASRQEMSRPAPAPRAAPAARPSAPPRGGGGGKRP